MAVSPGPRQPDRRAHRLQRRLRPAHGHRPRGGASSSGRAPTASCAATRSRTTRRRSSRSTRSPPPAAHDWLSYVAGVFWAFASEGLPVRGLDVVVDGDVPIGAGLSSSAALELATARALAAATGHGVGPRAHGEARAEGGERVRRDELRDHGPVRLGGLPRRATPSSSTAGRSRRGRCRCRPAAAVVVMDTGARRSLAGSAYNDRRAACERVVAEIAKATPGVRALRDVTANELEAAAAAPRRHRLQARQPRRPREQAAASRPRTPFSGRPRPGRAADERLPLQPPRPLRGVVRGARPRDRDRAAAAVLLRRADDGGRLRRLRGRAGEGRRRRAFCDAVLSAYKAKIDLPAALYPCRPEAGARLLD